MIDVLKLSIFHIHNRLHTTRPRAPAIGAEAARRLRRARPHIWMRLPHKWSFWGATWKGVRCPIMAAEGNRISFGEIVVSNVSVKRTGHNDEEEV